MSAQSVDLVSSSDYIYRTELPTPSIHSSKIAARVCTGMYAVILFAAWIIITITWNKPTNHPFNIKGVNCYGVIVLLGYTPLTPFEIIPHVLLPRTTVGTLFVLNPLNASCLFV